MRLLIDGDACPKSVKKICQTISLDYDIPAFIVSDLDHDFDDDDMDNIRVDTHPESTDYKIVALSRPGDIIITHDYGLASLVYTNVLAVIHPNGFIYNATNMDRLLYERYMNRKHHDPRKGKGPRIKKRSSVEDQAFEAVLLDIVAPVGRKAPRL